MLRDGLRGGHCSLFGFPLALNNSEREFAQCLDIAFTERVRLRGKNLDDSEWPLAVIQRHHENRPEPEFAARLGIDPLIYFAVGAVLNFSRLQAGSGQPGRTFDAHPEPRSRGPCRGAAFHFSVSRQRNGGAVRVSSASSLLDHFIQNQIERQVESDRTSAVRGQSLGDVGEFVAALNRK